MDIDKLSNQLNIVLCDYFKFLSLILSSYPFFQQLWLLYNAIFTIIYIFMGTIIYNWAIENTICHFSTIVAHITMYVIYGRSGIGYNSLKINV